MNTTANILKGTAAAIALFAAHAAYADEVSTGPESFAASAFEAQDFVGTIEIIVESREGIEVSASGEDEHMDHLLVRMQGDAVEVTYDNPRAIRRAWSDHNRNGWGFWRDRGDERLEEFPHVIVRLPAGTPVDIDGMSGRLDAGDLGGAFLLNGDGSLDADVGDVASANISSSGSGDIVLGEVGGALAILAQGSADVDVASAQTAAIRIHGSSDVDLGDIAGELSLESHGSGDLEAASVSGAIAISMRGSGDAVIRSGQAPTLAMSLRGSGGAQFHGTAGDTSVDVSGSGNARISSVNGQVGIRVNGSGDVRIEDGEASTFTARSNGSGDIYFGGRAENAQITTNGSGSVTIEDYHGRYHRS